MSATVSTAAAQDYRSAIQFLDAVADNVQRDGLRVTATHPGSYRVLKEICLLCIT